MTTLQSMLIDAILVANDISKHRHEVLIVVLGRIRRRLTVLDMRLEHDRLIDVLTVFEALVVDGFERTGNYHPAILGLRLVERR